MKSLREGQFSPIYILMGEESYFIDKITDYIAQHALREEERDFNQTVCFGIDVSAGQVADMARRFPMMAERQVVIVKEAQNIKNWDRLEQYFEKPQTSTVLVIAYKNTSQEWVRKYDGKHIGDVDVAIAVEHLCLAATERGLGTCWICNFIPEKLAQLFPQSEEFVPVALIPIGHIAPNCPVKEKSRKPLPEITETI